MLLIGLAALCADGAIAAPGTAEASLDRRMALLDAELKLSPTQEARIRALLQRQREAVQSVWADPAVPPAIRVARTQAVSERTADGIRALLDEEQRKKYIQPRPREAAVGGTGGVEAWMARGAGQ